MAHSIEWSNFDEVIEDKDSYPIFEAFLAEDGLDFLLEFRLMILGARLKIQEDPNLAQDPSFARTLRAAYKRYVKNGFETMPQFPQEILESIRNAYKTKTLSLATFNSTFQFTENLLRGQCFPNFLKSDNFISHINRDQEQEAPKEPQRVVNKEALEKIPENAKLQTLPRKSFKNEELFNINEVKINDNPYDIDEENRQRRIINAENAEDLRQMKTTKKLNYIPELDQNKNRQQRFIPSEDKTLKFYSLDEPMPSMNSKNPSAPYHATASTLNHVTRQNSAFHSIATDNSSTFSNQYQEDPLREERRQIRGERRQMRSGAQANHRSSLPDPILPGQQDKSVIKPMVKDPVTKKERPNLQFVDAVMSKLEEYIYNQSTKARHDEFKERLRRQHFDRISNPAESVIAEDDDENNESILDDHLDHMFTEEHKKREVQDIEMTDKGSYHHRRHRSSSSHRMMAASNMMTSTMRSSSSSHHHRNRGSADGQTLVSWNGSSAMQRMRISNNSGAFQNFNGYSTLPSSQPPRDPPPQPPSYSGNTLTKKMIEEHTRKQEEARRRARDQMKSYQNGHMHSHQQFPNPDYTSYNNNQKHGESTSKQNWPSQSNHHHQPNYKIRAIVKFDNENVPYSIPLPEDRVTLGKLKQALPLHNLNSYSFYFLSYDMETPTYFMENNDNSILPVYNGIIRVKVKPLPQANNFVP